MRFRILSLGLLVSAPFAPLVQWVVDKGLLPNSFWGSHEVFCNEAIFVLPWLLGSVVAAIILLALDKFTGAFGRSPPAGRRAMRAAVLTQAAAAGVYLIATFSMDWGEVLLFVAAFAWLLATVLALAGWIAFIVSKVRSRGRPA